MKIGLFLNGYAAPLGVSPGQGEIGSQDRHRTVSSAGPFCLRLEERTLPPLPADRKEPPPCRRPARPAGPTSRPGSDATRSTAPASTPRAPEPLDGLASPASALK
ncbi:hypothetical protein GCM10009616_11290 [Microlunatus lacustris]